MTLAGRNGSGKTTLLRILAGEQSADGGSVALGRGLRVALHDQRPPTGGATLRDYVGGGLAWITEIEDELAGLEQRMARGVPTRRRSTPMPARRRGSSTPAGIGGATRSASRCTVSASRTMTSTGRSRVSRAVS